MAKQARAKQTELSLLSSSLLSAVGMLRKNDPLRMAGATAFFTTFALPPIVFILARLFGLFVNPKTVGRGLIENLGRNLGNEGAQQVRQVIRSILGFSNNIWVIILGFVFLLFVATTLFIVIKNSLNDIWRITVKSSPGILFNIGSRLKSFAVILLVGILFFANLLFESIETAGGDYVQEVFGGGSLYFKLVFGEISSVIIVAAWFVILFRFLADCKPSWKASLIGGLMTGILFTAGRFVLRALLIKGNIGSLYGSSGSMVLVLLFVFYTSFIMYYGACFIAVYSEKKGWPLKPGEMAFHHKTAAVKA